MKNRLTSNFAIFIKGYASFRVETLFIFITMIDCHKRRNLLHLSHDFHTIKNSINKTFTIIHRSLTLIFESQLFVF